LAQPTKQPIQISFYFHSTVFGPLGRLVPASPTTLFFFPQPAEAGTAATAAVSRPRAAAMDASSRLLRKGNNTASSPLPCPSSNRRPDVSPPPLMRSYGALHQPPDHRTLIARLPALALYKGAQSNPRTSLHPNATIQPFTAPPRRRLSVLGEDQNQIPVAPSSFSPPRGKPPWPRVAARPSSGISMTGHGGQSSMDCALRWSTACGPSPCCFPLKNKSETRKCQPLCKKVHVLIQYQAVVHKIPSRTLVFKNKFQISPSHFPKITNRSLKSSSPYLFNRNSDFDDSHAKILKITSSFILCIHNASLLHID
jgi:hypothetical protein